MSDEAQAIRVVIVDDHAVVRAGIRALIETQDDLCVVGEASDANTAADVVRRTEPDVVLMDLNLGSGPGGAETTAVLVALPTPPKVLILTTYDTEADILNAIEAGAAGYLLKDAPPSDVFQAVRRTASGDTVLSPAVTATLVRRASSPQPAITDREVAVLELLADGRGNKDIARQLLVSEATIKSHLSHIYAKLDVDTRAGAVAKAVERRIIRT